jgi:hypothetical protein
MRKNSTHKLVSVGPGAYQTEKLKTLSGEQNSFNITNTVAFKNL